MMIKIDLNLFATLSKFTSWNDDLYTVCENTTIEELVAAIGIPAEHVKLIFVNGRKQDLSYRLKDQDRVGLFPPVGGG